MLKGRRVQRDSTSNDNNNNNNNNKRITFTFHQEQEQEYKSNVRRLITPQESGLTIWDHSGIFQARSELSETPTLCYLNPDITGATIETLK